MGNKELRRDFQHIYCINYWAVWEQFQPQRRGYNQSIERGRVFASKSRQKVRTSSYQLFKKSRADEDAWGASSSPSKWNRERPYEGMSTIGKTLVANAFKPSQVMQARSSHLSVQHTAHISALMLVSTLLHGSATTSVPPMSAKLLHIRQLDKRQHRAPLNHRSCAATVF